MGSPDPSDERVGQIRARLADTRKRYPHADDTWIDLLDLAYLLDLAAGIPALVARAKESQALADAEYERVNRLYRRVHAAESERRAAQRDADYMQDKWDHENERAIMAESLPSGRLLADLQNLSMERDALLARNQRLEGALRDMDELARTWVPAITEPYGEEAWRVLDAAAHALDATTEPSE